jgi:hypothetical protein
VASAAGLLTTVLPLVADGGRVETTAGTLVRGVPLTARADSTGIVVALLTCGVALAVLAEGRRSPLERSGLLLCVGGTLAVCLAGNAFLLVAGLELGNAGALLLGVAATRPGDVALRRRAQIAFGVQHLASLGLLAASLELLHAQGTADLAALPPGAVWTAIALPWALCGAVRLIAGAALASAGSRSSPAWIPLAAVPGGLIVLLRLGSVTGGSVGGLTAAVLMGGGLAAALGGAVVAARTWDTPVAAGRALLVSAGGQIVVLAGAGGTGATTAAAAGAVALVLAATAAPAWCDSANAASGPWLRAAALATTAALPCGAGMAALLAACGVEVAPGGGRAVVGLLAAIAWIAAAGAGAAAAARVLASDVDVDMVQDGLAATDSASAPRLDAGLALAASLSLALLPGTLLGGIADRIAGGTGAITAVDAAAVRGPGFGWGGGYLTVALLVAGLAALAAARLQGIPLSAARAAPAPPPGVRAPGLPPRLAGWRLPDGLPERVLAAVRGFDAWLVRQPDLPSVLLCGVACLVWFQYRP